MSKRKALLLLKSFKFAAPAERHSQSKIGLISKHQSMMIRLMNLICITSREGRSGKKKGLSRGGNPVLAAVKVSLFSTMLQGKKQLFAIFKPDYAADAQF